MYAPAVTHSTGLNVCNQSGAVGRRQGFLRGPYDEFRGAHLLFLHQLTKIKDGELTLHKIDYATYGVDGVWHLVSSRKQLQTRYGSSSLRTIRNDSDPIAFGNEVHDATHARCPGSTREIKPAASTPIPEYTACPRFGLP